MNRRAAVKTVSNISRQESSKITNDKYLIRYFSVQCAQIATASEEQGQVISDISQTTDSVKELSHYTQRFSSSTGEQAKALIISSYELKEMVAGFNYS